MIAESEALNRRVRDMSEAEKRARLRRRRFVALAALVALLIASVASSVWQHAIPALQWLRAFAEAGVAGAIADWYAVVALFRHPLGLRLPHTAIIPRNKDRIAASVGAFIETNFLTSENVSEKLDRLDLAASASEWLREPANARNLADALCDLVPQTLETIDDAEIRMFVERIAGSLMESFDLVVVVERLMTTVIDADRDRAVLKRVLLWLRDWMSNNREAIKIEFGRVSRYTPGFLDAYIVNRFVEGVAHLLEEAAEDPNHQIWQEIDRAIEELRRNMSCSPALREQIATRAREGLSSIAESDLAASLWAVLKIDVIADLSDDHSRIRGWTADAFLRLGAALADDRVVQQKLNAWWLAAVEKTLPRARPAIGRWIADIVKSWDEEKITRKLEMEVGTDLQYIRLNGALVGGLVGLALHAASSLA
jgi:uncharacterized membrane-anchored protein YjiN (DUF445 family)